MRISTLAFANLNRRKGKALFLTIGIAIGIGTVVALLSLTSSIQEEIGAQLDRFGANIVIVPQSSSLALDYGGVAVPGVTFDVHPLSNMDIAKIRSIAYHDRLSVIAPKVLSGVHAEKQQVLLAGVDFKNELKLHPWWTVVGRRPENDHDLLIGSEAAHALGLVQPPPRTSPDIPVGHHLTSDQSSFTVVRDRIELAGKTHQVAGVLAPTGGPEDRMIFGELTHVQGLVNRPDQLDIIEVSALCKGCPVEDIVAQIREQLPHAKVSAVQQAVKARTDMVNRLTRFSGAMAVVVLVIGALMIFTTMMGSVVERTREIGVLRAIGFRRTHIVRGLILEVASISVLGGFFGWAAGLAASWLALPYFTETAAGRELHPELLVFAIGAAVVIGTLSSIYPALRASHLDPSDAVRAI